MLINSTLTGNGAASLAIGAIGFNQGEESIGFNLGAGLSNSFDGILCEGGHLAGATVQRGRVREIRLASPLGGPVNLVLPGRFDSDGETHQHWVYDKKRKKDQPAIDLVPLENVRFEADKTAVYATLGDAAAQISTAEVSGQLQNKVTATVEAAKVSGGSAALVGNQLMTNAFRFR